MTYPVIGVAGQMQNGKDTIADYLGEKTNWNREAFALNVKRVFMDTFDVDLDFIEEWKVKSEIPEGFDLPIRQGLQYIGDGFRQIQGNIWIDLAFRKMKGPSIISDVRYINEIRKVRAEGGLNVLVWRPGKENDDPNGSEAQLRPIVEWFKSTDSEGFVVGDMGTEADLSDLPDGAEMVDVFIRNEEGLGELYAKVDEWIVPWAVRTIALNKAFDSDLE